MLCRRLFTPWTALFVFAISAIFSQAAAPQETENPVTTLHADARSVVVDVVVTDKDGKALTGLTRQDFQVFEDGKPQALTFFEQHTGAGASAAPIQPQPTLPSNTFTNIPAAPPTDSVNVLFLDALNTNTKDQIFVQKEVTKYLATVPPGVRVAIFQLSDRLHILQGLEANSSVLQSAVAQNKSGASATSSAASVGINKGGANLKAPQIDANYRTAMTLDALQQIARYLAGVPGRKNLIWFTSDIPILLSASASGPGSDASTSTSNPTGDSPYYEKSQATVSMLANAQISVYPVEASGVATDSLSDASTVPTAYQGQTPTNYETQTLREGAKDRNIRHLTMDQLAHDTGGKASYNQNGLAEAIAADIDNGARYYTIAYTPSNRSEKGKERKIEVKLASAKYSLAYRHSYLEDNPEQMKAEAAQAKDPLRPLMERGMPNSTELRYQTRIAPDDPQPAAGTPRAGENPALKPPFTRYGVDFALSTDNLSLVIGADGVRQDRIEVALVAYSRDGKPLNWMVHLVGLVVRPEQYAIAQKSGIPFHLDIDVPPGDVYLRSGIYDISSSKAGTLEIPMGAIPALGK
jgi:VWFA-related protein